MDNIFMMILVAGIVLVGALPSFYIIFSMPVVIFQKFRRKIKYGTSMFD